MKTTLFFVMLVFLGLVFAPPISSCTTIGAPGSYFLTGNVAGSAPIGALGNACIYINSPDVIFDCRGFEVSSNVPHTTAGENAVAVELTNNVTIKGCTLRNSTNGIIVSATNNVSIQNITTYNVYRGVYLQDSGIVDATINNSNLTAEERAISIFNVDKLRILNSRAEGKNYSLAYGSELKANNSIIRNVTFIGRINAGGANVLKNMTIENSNLSGGIAIRHLIGGGIKNTYISNITGWDPALHLTRNITNVIIEGNVFEGSGYGSFIGSETSVRHYQKNITIRNNTFRNLSQYGIRWNFFNVTEVLVENNILENITNGGMLFLNNGTGVVAFEKLVVRNNTLLNITNGDGIEADPNNNPNYYLKDVLIEENYCNTISSGSCIELGSSLATANKYGQNITISKNTVKNIVVGIETLHLNASVLVENNLIENATSTGIIMTSDGSEPQKLTARNNAVTKSKSCAYVYYTIAYNNNCNNSITGMSVGHGSEFYNNNITNIENNTVVFNSYGILVWQAPTIGSLINKNIQIYSNNIKNIHGPGILIIRPTIGSNPPTIGQINITNNRFENVGYGNTTTTLPAGYPIPPSTVTLISQRNVNIYSNNLVGTSKYGIIINGTNVSNSYIEYTLNSENKSVEIEDLLNITLETYLIGSSNMTIRNATVTGYITFDNPAGGGINATRIFINDSAPNEEYFIRWTLEPAPHFWTNITSFNNKYLEIVNLTPTTIDLIQFTWTDAETIGYDEKTLSLWKWDGTNWSLVNDTPDTVGNTLSIINYNNFSIFGLFAQTAPVPTPTDPQLKISVSASCNKNEILVTSDNLAIEDAVIVIKQGNNILESGQTDSSGKYSFTGCGGDVTIEASKSGYNSDQTVLRMVACESCAEDILPPGDVTCDCGLVFEGQCITYECCSDSDCPSGYACNNNQCEPQGCLTDNDCAGNEYCNIPNGELVGSCEPVTGECGYAENHQWINYECCSDSDCPSNKVCEQNVCVFYEIDCVETVNVNENIECVVKKDGQLCKECVVEITLPNGEKTTETTDQEGKIIVKAQQEGEHQFRIANALDLSKALAPAVITLDETTEWPLVLLLLFIVILIVVLLCWKRKHDEEIKIKELYKEKRITKLVRDELLEELKQKKCWENFEDIEEELEREQKK